MRAAQSWPNWINCCETGREVRLWAALGGGSWPTKGLGCLMRLSLLRSVIPQVEAPLAPTRLSPDILATAVSVCVCGRKRSKT